MVYPFEAYLLLVLTRDNGTINYRQIILHDNPLKIILQSQPFNLLSLVQFLDSKTTLPHYIDSGNRAKTKHTPFHPYKNQV